jgi:hypothetical protein
MNRSQFQHDYPRGALAVVSPALHNPSCQYVAAVHACLEVLSGWCCHALSGRQASTRDSTLCISRTVSCEVALCLLTRGHHGVCCLRSGARVHELFALSSTQWLHLPKPPSQCLSVLMNTSVQQELTLQFGHLQQLVTQARESRRPFPFAFWPFLRTFDCCGNTNRASQQHDQLHSRSSWVKWLIPTVPCQEPRLSRVPGVRAPAARISGGTLLLYLQPTDRCSQGRSRHHSTSVAFAALAPTPLYCLVACDAYLLS